MEAPTIVSPTSQEFRGRRYQKGLGGYYRAGCPTKYLHRAVFEANFGPIPPGCRNHIHHKSEDKDDNRPENLEDRKSVV